MWAEGTVHVCYHKVAQLSKHATALKLQRVGNPALLQDRLVLECRLGVLEKMKTKNSMYRDMTKHLYNKPKESTDSTQEIQKIICED